MLDVEIAPRGDLLGPISGLMPTVMVDITGDRNYDFRLLSGDDSMFKECEIMGQVRILERGVNPVGLRGTENNPVAGSHHLCDFFEILKLWSIDVFLKLDVNTQ